MNVSHCTVQLPTFLERNARSHVQAEPPSMSPHAAHHTRHARADLSTSQQQPSAHTQRDKTTTVAIGPELAPPRPLQRTHAPPPHTHARRWPRIHTTGASTLLHTQSRTDRISCRRATNMRATLAPPTTTTRTPTPASEHTLRSKAFARHTPFTPHIQVIHCHSRTLLPVAYAYTALKTTGLKTNPQKLWAAPLSGREEEDERRIM